LAFPAETDMRFLLLIFAAAGATIGLGDFAAYCYVQYLPVNHAYDKLISICGGLLFAALVFLIAHRRARHAAQRRIVRERLQPFPPAAAGPDERESLKRMAAHVARVAALTHEPGPQGPRFLWNTSTADSRAPTGIAFGFRRRLFVRLNQGLHASFVETPGAERFNAVLLHELGHLANRDVSRTTFSIELGRAFTQAALVLAGLTEAYLIVQVLRRLIGGTLADEHMRVFGLMFQLAASTAIVIALMEIVRASVLRVREYYADERARQWLGDEAPLRAMLVEREPAREEGRSASEPALGLVQRTRPGSASGGNLFRTYAAPLHPRHGERVATLADPRGLFAVELLSVFLAGVIGGVALNANNMLLSQTLGLAALSNNLLSTLLTQPMSAAAGWLIFLASTLLTFLAVVGIIGLCALFFAVPLAGSVGLIVQRAAFADSLMRGMPPLLPPHRLARCALVVGFGIVLGGALTPASGALTLHLKDLPLVPLFVAAWAGVSFLWLWPLRWISARAYRSYAGARPPLLRRRCLAALSGLAISPLLLMTMLAQGAATTYDLQPMPPDGMALLVGAWLGSLALLLVAWGLGALLMRLAGWFGPPRCPACGEQASPALATALHCSSCGRPLKEWALTPTPLRIPPPPPPPQTFSETPPPL
jgi:Zn-dependent protease with chaperone function